MKIPTIIVGFVSWESDELFGTLVQRDGNDGASFSLTAACGTRLKLHIAHNNFPHIMHEISNCPVLRSHFVQAHERLYDGGRVRHW